ncbi:MAG: hypothetical protein WBE26_10025 [Phycisphaerae bacterium]
MTQVPWALEVRQLGNVGFKKSGLQVVQVHRPLGRADEPYEWVNETTIAPWVIYMLEKA